ncbi:MAG: hypothetical protein JXN62_10170 [Bacteroidales bacterium]|nr:hypothetical protein [Bacteroidales bacterium]
MIIKEQLLKLANEKSKPCVTISMNTHRTHPDNAQDEILLKKLLTEAEKRLIDEFGKRESGLLVKKLKTVTRDVDINYNLESLHIFLSEQIKEIIRLPFKINSNMVYIADRFSVRQLIKAYNRGEEYYILLLSQSGVNLYEAINDSIITEVSNRDFPFSQNPYFVTEPEKRSDAKQIDNMVRQFLNKVDKALVKIQNKTGLSCVVVCTEDNYSRLMQVADKPSVYYGFATIDYNKTKPHQIVGQTVEIVKKKQKEKRLMAMTEMKEAVAGGKVVTDLQEIYQAAIDGRGDLLIVNEDFEQPVLMTGKRTFKLISDPAQPDAIEDITSVIAWEIFAKNGRVIFTAHDQIIDHGKILLKTRY